MIFYQPPSRARSVAKCRASAVSRAYARHVAIAACASPPCATQGWQSLIFGYTPSGDIAGESPWSSVSQKRAIQRKGISIKTITSPETKS